MANPFSYTPVNFTWPLNKIRSKGTLVSFGSCFSEYIADELFNAGFKGAQNPNGILYNAFSINHAIQMLDTGYEKSDFFEFNNLYHSFAHHGAFSKSTLEEALNNAEQKRRECLKYLKKADCIIITLSSSVVYRFIKTKAIVANCHKIPGTEFERTMLTAEQNRAALTAACRKIREFNPAGAIVLTLSPVRHYPGDLMLNALSKARCLDALRETEKAVPDTVYYPSYETVMDEMRDYRFFADDMLHPSESARKIILERFATDCFSEKTLIDIKDAEQRKRRSCHIPLND